MALFAWAGVVVLVVTRAASPAAYVEPESTNLLSVTNVPDSTASAGHFLQFGTGAGSNPSGPLDGDGTPTTYVTELELDQVQAKIRAGQQPWKSAYDSLISRANGELSQAPKSVVDDDGKHPFDDPFDPDKRLDYAAAREMSTAIYTLSAAWRLSGDSKYASKALSLLDHWALKDSTYMDPDLGKASSERLLAIITMPSMVYGGDLIWGYSGWTQPQRTEFTAWVKKLGDSARVTPPDNSGSQQNKENWRWNLVAVCAGWSRDKDLMQYVVDQYKTRLYTFVGGPGQKVGNNIDAAGLLLKEYDRPARTFDGGLHYSNYALNAMTQMARAVYVNGEDLYTYRAPQNGATLKLAMDRMAPYTINPSTWTFTDNGGLSAEREAYWELAYQRFGDPKYLQALNKWGGRPAVSGYSIMGNLTVIHGRP